MEWTSITGVATAGTTGMMITEMAGHQIVFQMIPQFRITFIFIWNGMQQKDIEW